MEEVTLYEGPVHGLFNFGPFYKFMQDQGATITDKNLDGEEELRIKWRLHDLDLVYNLKLQPVKVKAIGEKGRIRGIERTLVEETVQFEKTKNALKR